MTSSRLLFFFFFFNDTATTEIYTLSLHDALPICALPHPHARLASGRWLAFAGRESNPLDSVEKFPSATSDFLLSQIYPGATANLPHGFRLLAKSPMTPPRDRPRPDARDP